MIQETVVFDIYWTTFCDWKIWMKFTEDEPFKPQWILKGRYTFSNCRRAVFSVSVSQHKHKKTSLWNCELNCSSELRENDDRKNTLVGWIWVLSDRNKRLLARRFLLFYWEITPFSKSMLLQSEPFLTMFYTINSSVMLVTDSVFKLIFVLSNYQTCTFPLSTCFGKEKLRKIPKCDRGC